jgi:hypothetical protein
MDKLAGEAGNAAAGELGAPPESETPKFTSFDEVFNQIEAKRTEVAKGEGDDADDDEDAEKDKAGEEGDKGKGDADDDNSDGKDPKPEDEKVDKDAKVDADDKHEEAEKKDPTARAARFAELKGKAGRLDEIETKYADIGGLEGLEDFADLVRAYKDPAKVDDFIAQIGQLPAAHQSSIVSKLFYDALDVPENRVEAINDALLAVSETTSLKITGDHIIKNAEELDKVIKYVAAMLEDDRDDFFDTIEDTIKKIENLTPRERELQEQLRAKESKEVKKPESDTTDGFADMNFSIEAYVDYSSKAVANSANPQLESLGLTVIKGDTDELKVAKETLGELVRLGVTNKVGNTDLGKDVLTNIGAIAKGGEKPGALIKNLKSRFESATAATAKDLVTKLKPIFGAAKAKKKDPPEGGGSDEIITEEKGDTILSDTSKGIKNYRDEKDPFGARLNEIAKAK